MTKEQLLRLLLKEKKILDAKIRAFDRLVDWIPQYTMQTFATSAKEHGLNSSYNDFMASVVIKYDDDGNLIVAQDDQNWLGMAVEDGVPSYSMVAKAFEKGKYKVSKKGFKYKVVPIQIYKDRPQATTHESMLFMRNILPLFEKKPRWKPEIFDTKDPISGTITARQQMDDKRPFARGVYKLRRYQNEQAVAKGYKFGETTQIAIFRTMSEAHPEKFIHPGIQGAHLFKKVISKVDQDILTFWDTFVKQELRRNK